MPNLIIMLIRIRAVRITQYSRDEKMQMLPGIPAKITGIH